MRLTRHRRDSSPPYRSCSGEYVIYFGVCFVSPLYVFRLSNLTALVPFTPTRLSAIDDSLDFLSLRAFFLCFFFGVPLCFIRESFIMQDEDLAILELWLPFFIFSARRPASRPQPLLLTSFPPITSGSFPFFFVLLFFQLTF